MTAPTWQVDERLKDWATDAQKELIDAINLHRSITAAAKSLNRNFGNCARSLAGLKKRAASQGYSPEHGLSRVIPEPYVGKGHSTLDRIDLETGERTMVLQWTKSRLDDQAYMEAIKGAVTAFAASVGPVPVAEPRADRATDIVPWIQIGDAHLGMLAHEAQTNENFNLEIAERELCSAISILIDEMGEHDRIVINDLGDFTHYENEDAVTEASGHRLDAAAFFALLIETYSKVMRFIVTKALEKGNTVDVIVNQGNHSRKNDLWMAELLRVGFGHTGRVNVLNNTNVFIGYRMGNTLVMTHHSDKCKPAKLAQVMTSDFRIDYGETEYHYVDIGHIHHGMVLKEHPDIDVESFNTLAPKDKWAHEGGWRSRSSITVVWRSRTYGDVGRRRLPIREVRDRIAAKMKAEGKAVYMPTVRRAFAV